MKELTPQYNAKNVEGKIYKLWEESGFFNPDNLPDKREERFSMVLPPPNVTGTLHIGHALTVAIEDTIVRYQRMTGKKTLWLPGTDHASIATETKFLKEKKLSRSDYNEKREEFIGLINEFALANQAVIIKQLRAMGASLDWSRLAFALDDQRKKAVEEAFLRMNQAGLIYSGEYLVNWDIKGQTTISDEEVEYETAPGTLYTFKYWKDFPIAIATTRPETKLGDIAVAVHPDDERYKKYIGETYTGKFIDTPLEIKIVSDKSVDPKFGTGAVGITPAHSKTDWEIATRNNLPWRPFKQVINEYGKVIAKDEFGKLRNLGNLKILEAREKVVERLKEWGLLEKEELIEHNIARAQRSGGLIEILPKRHQFFVNVNKPIASRDGKTLKELMRRAVASGQIKITPEYFTKSYLHWIENLRDWNISRQVWYGHTIPAWYLGDEITISSESPGEDWQPINDTFDTWFSSGLWTFSALGWPEETKDLKTYHPTDLLETGYDILFFWVARMILMSTFLLEEVPFHNVYLHGLVRDKEHRKMSKSLGNVIDPLAMTEKYGTDALRLALIFNTAAGTDSVLAEDKIKGMKHFANKLWNIGRYILTNVEISNFKFLISNAERPGAKTDADKEILEKLNATIKSVTENIETFALHEAAQEIYQFTWHEFADVYIEKSKDQLKNAATKENTEKILAYVLINVLKLLHPFMPFITEGLYQLVTDGKEILMVAAWPSAK